METNNDMNTLIECISSIEKRGYTTNFIVSEECLMKCDKGVCYKPEQVKINTFYRFEGDSDPADSSILYAIETVDGKKGYLSDAYGPYSDPRVSNFILKVGDISKHVGDKHPNIWRKIRSAFS
jgi:hypothetical protein